MTASDLLIFNWTVLGIWFYTLGLGIAAAYVNDHPPTTCTACNIMLALLWPGTVCNYLWRRIR